MQHLICIYEIEKSCNNTLTTNTKPYSTATRRAGVMAFYIQLKYVIEAAYIISHTAQILEQNGIDVNNYSQLSTQLFLKEGVEHLSEDEIEEPYNIVKDFFSRFPLLNSRAEIWDLFAAAIKHDDKATNKTVLLINYQQLYTLIEALHTLHSQLPQAP